MWAKPSAGPERLKVASKLPDGAHFYRCALQVNPFAYLGRQNKSTSLQDEATYNAAIIAACLDQDIKVIGVTDHYRVDGSAGLVKTAREAGLFAFSGFEAVAKDGLHILCLFNQDKDSILERYIGQCGIHSLDDASPIGTLDCLELLSHAKELGGGLHCGSCRRRWRRPAEKAVRSDPNKCLEIPWPTGLRASRTGQRCPTEPQIHPGKQGCIAQPRSSRCDHQCTGCQFTGRSAQTGGKLPHQDVGNLGRGSAAGLP